MDVLKHIIEEHDEFRKLMDEIENSKDDKQKAKKFKELYSDLYGHHEAEEKVIFPEVKRRADEEGVDVVLEMIEEHSLGNYQFSVIEKTFLENETWDAKFSVLKEVLTHHMDEEEEDFIPLAKKLLKKEEREELYDPFEEAMDKYKSEQLKKLK